MKRLSMNSVRERSNKLKAVLPLYHLLVLPHPAWGQDFVKKRFDGDYEVSLCLAGGWWKDPRGEF